MKVGLSETGIKGRSQASRDCKEEGEELTLHVENRLHDPKGLSFSRLISARAIEISHPLKMED